MRRRILLAIATVAIVALGALASRGSAAAVNTTQRLAPAVPCGSNGVATGARQALHHAGLAIVFPQGRTETRCIEFSEDEISGLDLLRRSGLPLVISGFGGIGSAVCRIDDVGCSDPGNCFCQCAGATCMFWTYFTLQDGSWHFQNTGAAQRVVHDGDADAWVWGSGRTSPQVGPPCPTPAPTPVSGSVPTPVLLATAERPNASLTAPATARRASITPAESLTATPPAQVVAPATTSARSAAQGVTASKDDTGGGPPTALIAFAAVAAALIVLAGGIALRRRYRG